MILLSTFRKPNGYCHNVVLTCWSTVAVHIAHVHRSQAMVTLGELTGGRARPLRQHFQSLRCVLSLLVVLPPSSASSHSRRPEISILDYPSQLVR
jgi:hypothetical protein